eukprot:TRINITY_DN5906_c0_g1_i12.p2 TRINITY_DN5906_c0_g1~~TRINITY_DN5906_c0_g1_i12.p2  ORF type:complete len:323 (+),score=69.98 TRINITY_DN5906_c0_g1_i12:338-1306(+)
MYFACFAHLFPKTYVVDVDPEREKCVTVFGGDVALQKLESNLLNVRCKLSADEEWFLKVFNGDIPAYSAVMNGKIYVHSFAFRELQSFTGCFNFATDNWVKFYTERGLPPQIIWAHPELHEENVNQSPKGVEDEEADGLSAVQQNLKRLGIVLTQEEEEAVPAYVPDSLENCDHPRHLVRLREFEGINDLRLGLSLYTPHKRDILPLGLSRISQYRHSVIPTLLSNSKTFSRIGGAPMLALKSVNQKFHVRSLYFQPAYSHYQGSFDMESFEHPLLRVHAPEPEKNLGIQGLAKNFLENNLGPLLAWYLKTLDPVDTMIAFD